MRWYPRRRNSKPKVEIAKLARKQLTAWFVANDKSYSNEAQSYCFEYFARMRLAKLGFMSNFNDLSLEDAEAFLAIDGEVESLKAKMAKKGK